MQRLVIGILIIKPNQSLPHYQRGFTFIEIILVTFLIGVVTVMIGLKVSVDENHVARAEAHRIAKVINLLVGESMASGRPAAVEWVEKSNQFDFLTYTDQWEKYEKQSLLRSRQIPEEVLVRYRILADAKLKRLVITPDGLTPPFVIQFFGVTRDYVVTIDEYYKIIVLEEEKEVAFSTVSSL